MGAPKYGSCEVGVWGRDANGMPCLDLDYGRSVPGDPGILHPLASGRTTALADRFGRVRFLAGIDSRPVCLSMPSRFSCGAFWVRVSDGEASRTLLLGELLAAEAGRIRLGIGYVRYAGNLVLASERSVEFSLTFRAVPEQSWLMAELELVSRCRSSWKASLAIYSDVTFTGPSGAGGVPFAKDGVAMLTDLDPHVGDWVLSARERWQAEARAGRLTLCRSVDLQPDTPWQETFVVGCQKDCTLDRVRADLASLDAEELARVSAQRLVPDNCLAPERWMRDEVAWTQSCFFSLELPANTPQSRLLFPSLGEGEASAPRCRDLLQLVLPLSTCRPDLALSNLWMVAAAQHSCGRVPEELGQLAGPGNLDPRRDRSDLEIWFLIGWCDYLAGREDWEELLGRDCEFADGLAATLWDHLVAALGYVRDEVRCGRNGLVRILAGDSCAFLNGVGAAGQGESVLNSAMLVYALARLADLARDLGNTLFADQAMVWHQLLSRAVGEAFDDNWFCRAFDDKGKAVGGSQEQRLFLDVQTWAVLAKCGTSAQRETALRQALERNCQGDYVCSLSRPYGLPAPESVSRVALLPGDGENGGMLLPQVALFCWALVEQHMTEFALKPWENMAIRKRLGLDDAPGLAALHSHFEFSSQFAGCRSGGAGLAADRGTAGLAAHAVAWQTFAMHKILAGGQG